METKTIKISKENYEWLCEEAGKLQAKEKKTVSIDEALSKLHKKMNGKISDLAGAWKMDDKEVETFMEDLDRGWKRWKLESA
ncbi:MAG: hypothetical protein AABX29_09095 [Nanoarchaeota archaeon]